MYSKIKKIIPPSIKYILWYIFKSEQRKISKFSLFRDLYGIFVHFNIRFAKNTKLRPITVCTGLYNRSDNFINSLLKSLNECDHKDLINISIFDCSSNDIDNLENKIKNNWNSGLIFKKEKIKFSRALAFNNAVKFAKTELIFLCDADMSVPKDLIQTINYLVKKNRVWIPCVFYLNKGFKNDPLYKNGEWMLEGKGMVACLKSDFLKIGCLNESYTEWGGEDTELWERFHKSKFIVIRNKQKNLIHNWHESHNPKYKH